MEHVLMLFFCLFHIKLLIWFMSEIYLLVTMNHGNGIPYRDTRQILSHAPELLKRFMAVNLGFVEFVTGIQTSSQVLSLVSSYPKFTMLNLLSNSDAWNEVCLCKIWHSNSYAKCHCHSMLYKLKIKKLQSLFKLTILSKAEINYIKVSSILMFNESLWTSWICVQSEQQSLCDTLCIGIPL